MSALSEIHNDYLADVIVNGNVPILTVKQELNFVISTLSDPKWEFEEVLAGHDYSYWNERRKILVEVINA